MLTSILSLLTGGAGGGLLALGTGLLKWFQNKQDADHEYRMTQLQLEIDKARSAQQIDLVHAQGQSAVDAKEMDAFIAAIDAQGKPTGIPWADALNASVRPVLTYWWMVLFSVYEGATLYVLGKQSATIEQFVAGMWGPREWAIFGTILGFWFVNRSLWHNQRNQ